MVKKQRNKQKTQEIDYPNKISKLIAIYQQQINDIMESGEVAPPGCWIVRYQARGRKARYWYYKLHSTERIFSTGDPDINSKYKHLGKAGSPAYLDAVASVLRRAQIEGLERAIQTLKSGLIDLADEMERNQKK
ncbi:MAG: hypothetical protein AB4063_22055 [Crocosphaera sp.]